MKSIKISITHGTSGSIIASQNTYKIEENDTSSLQKKFGVIPNRWIVESNKKTRISNSISNSEVFITDFFKNKNINKELPDTAASSQIDQSNFQETRIIKQKTFRTKALDALRRAEEKKEKSLRQDVVIDD
jgi:hypothetical protein